MRKLNRTALGFSMTIEDTFDFVDQLKNFEVREYQLTIAKKIITTPKHYLINLPWGSGKTLIALLVMAAYRKLHQKQRPLIIFTSGGAGGADRCQQARQKAIDFGFNQFLGYLVDAMSLRNLRHSLVQRAYEAADVIFAPIGKLSGDIAKGRLPPHTLKRLKLLIVDEATDMVARGVDGFRVSKPFELLYNEMQKQDIHFIGLTASIDSKRLIGLAKLFDGLEILKSDEATQFSYKRYFIPIKDPFIQKIDKIIGVMMNDALQGLNKLIPPMCEKITIERAMQLLYGGVVDYLARYQKLPHCKKELTATHVQQLQDLFHLIHRLNYVRLLAFNSTPHDLYQYVSSLSSSFFIYDLEVIPYYLDEESSCSRCGQPITPNHIAFYFPDLQKTPLESELGLDALLCDVCTEKLFFQSHDEFQIFLTGAQQHVKNVKAVESTAKGSRWSFITQIANERYNRARLSTKCLRAVSISKKLVNQGKKLILITRYRSLAKQVLETLRFNTVERSQLITGAHSLDYRKEILRMFKQGEIDALVFTPVGSRGLDLYWADAIIHLDITTNVDEMLQRRERIRGGEEYILFYENTSEEQKLKRIFGDELEQPPPNGNK